MFITNLQIIIIDEKPSPKISFIIDFNKPKFYFHQL